MRRLFLLARDEAQARTLVERLRAEAPLVGDIKLTGASREFAAALGVRRGSIEEFTNVRMGRRRGALLGAAAAVALSLLGFLAPAGSLPLEPWLAITLAALGGGALGVAFGTIVGSSQRHPIYETHRAEIEDGAMLVTVEMRKEHLGEVVQVARGVDPSIRIEARTLTNDLLEMG